MEMSPTKKPSAKKTSIISSGSPMRESNISRTSKMSTTGYGGSPQKNVATISMHKRTGDEVK